MNRLTVNQLASYLQVTKRTIQRRAKEGNWRYRETKSLGGTRREYEFESLPLTVKNQTIAAITKKHAALNLEITTKDRTGEKFTALTANDPYINHSIKVTKSWCDMHMFANQIDDDLALDKEFVQRGLLSLARLFVAKHNEAKIKGFDRFCQQYKAREIEINPKIYTVVKSVSRITLLRWEKVFSIPKIKSDDELTNQTLALFSHEVMSLIEEFVNVIPDITAKRLEAYIAAIATNKKYLPNKRVLSGIIKQYKANG